MSEKYLNFTINDFVKIVRWGERFWVLVESLTDEGGVGIVDNEPLIAPFKLGDKISFTRSEVIDVMPKRVLSNNQGDRG
jgi:hypothetical protein